MNCSTPGLPVHHQLPELSKILLVHPPVKSHFNHICWLLQRELRSMGMWVLIQENEDKIGRRNRSYTRQCQSVLECNLASTQAQASPSVLGRLWSCAPHAHCSSDTSSAFTLGGGFPGGVSGKDPTCQCRRHKRRGLDPWVKKISWRGAWQPTPVLLPRESHGPRSLAWTTVHGVSKNQTWLKWRYPGGGGSLQGREEEETCVWQWASQGLLWKPIPHGIS